MKTAEEESEIAGKRFKAGSGTILDVSNAHTNLATATDTRVENIFNYEAARVSH